MARSSRKKRNQPEQGAVVPMMIECQHDVFAATVNVRKHIDEQEDGEDIVTYTATMTVECKNCGTDFAFEGGQLSVDLPIVPVTQGMETHAGPRLLS